MSAATRRAFLAAQRRSSPRPPRPPGFKVGDLVAYHPYGDEREVVAQIRRVRGYDDYGDFYRFDLDMPDGTRRIANEGSLRRTSHVGANRALPSAMTSAYSRGSYASNELLTEHPGVPPAMLEDCYRRKRARTPKPRVPDAYAECFEEIGAYMRGNRAGRAPRDVPVRAMDKSVAVYRFDWQAMRPVGGPVAVQTMSDFLWQNQGSLDRDVRSIVIGLGVGEHTLFGAPTLYVERTA